MSTRLALLIVTWQAETRRYFPVGRVLRLPDGRYEWAYVRAVEEARAHGFSGLPGYEAIEQVSVGADLPAFFAHRLPARGSRRSLAGSAAANDSFDPAPITLLVPAGAGRSERLEVFAPPLPAPFGKYWGVFSARGVGRIPGSEAALESLVPHEPLRLRPEPQNPYNPRALLIERADETAIGYVPDDLANELAEAGAALEAVPAGSADGAFRVELASSERVTHPPVNPIYAVLCRYTCGAALGTRLFRSERYQPLASEAHRPSGEA
jgi:HIRAN domain-containing protein